MTPGGRPPLWRELALGGAAASLWVAVVYTLVGRGLSVRELAGDGAAYFLMLPTVMYALDGIAARRRWRPPAAHRSAHTRSIDGANCGANRRPVNR